jgi:hypothetical protein
MASLRSCATAEFKSQPQDLSGMYTHDGGINLFFILVVSTLVYFNAHFISHI